MMKIIDRYFFLILAIAILGLLVVSVITYKPAVYNIDCYESGSLVYSARNLERNGNNYIDESGQQITIDLENCIYYKVDH